MANDPMMQPAADKSPLFGSTRQIAGQVAAAHSANRRAQILRHLQDHGPSTLFEVAAAIGCFDHQISGRITNLASEGLIERTGERRVKPTTHCPADVWRLRAPSSLATGNSPLATSPELFGYPLTLIADGADLYRRVAIQPENPGVPYVRDASNGGQSVAAWFSIAECPGCGRELRLVEEAGKKLFTCGQPQCKGARWQVTTVRIAGALPTLALVRRAL